MTGTNPARRVLLEALGKRLKRLRLAYGETLHDPRFTMASMARALQVDEERYRTWERGLREPPLWILLKIKHLTGYSIDTLLTGALTMPGEEIFADDVEAFEQGIAMAQRIRCVRELKEPDIEVAAEVMNVRLETWIRWELGLERPTFRKLAEFAGRFNVSIDFLWSGRLIGVDPDFQAVLLYRHPELRPPEVALQPLAYSRRANGGDGNNDPRNRSQP